MFYSRRLRIVGTGSYTPERVVSNEELAQRVDTTAQWVEDNLGIKERRVATEDQFTSDLATEAARSAIASVGCGLDDIDAIILATATPDRRAPSTACLVKHKLGISNHCPALDINAVCSGFVYALSLASSWVQTEYQRVLVIGADTFSKITDWTRRDCVFFGDGAGAAILERTDYQSAIFASNLYSNCIETDNFTVYPGDKHFTMNGKAVYETGSRVLPQAIKALLDENGFSIEDVACIIPHQPSVRLLKKTAEVLGIPFERIKTNMARYANTSSSTVPLLLDEVNKRGELKKDDLVVFAAVGSGWTWGAALYRWH